MKAMVQIRSFDTYSIFGVSWISMDCKLFKVTQIKQYSFLLAVDLRYDLNLGE